MSSFFYAPRLNRKITRPFFSNIFLKGRVPSLKIVSIITSRDRHGFGPALGGFHPRGCRCTPPILSCARLDRAQSEAVEVPGAVQAVPPGLLLYC